MREKSTEKRVAALIDADRALLAGLAKRLNEMAAFIARMKENAVTELTEAVKNVFGDIVEDETTAQGAFIKQLEAKGFQKILAKLVTIDSQPTTISQKPEVRRPIVTMHVSAQASPATRSALIDVARHVVARPQGQPDSNGQLPVGERKILIATAQAGERGATREQLTVNTGYKKSSRDTYLQRLSQRNYVSVEGDRILLTQDGLNAIGQDYEPLPMGDELLQHWLNRLPEGEARVLRVVASAGGASVDRDQISEATDYKKSSRDTYIQRLSQRRLVIPESRGTVRASAELFG